MSGITLKEVGGSLVINVPEVQTLIGRGQFLQVTDKRVSRSHALLDIMDRKLYITPTHTNPCFLRRQGNKEHTIMTKDVKTLLNHGDAFGLLPDQLYYLVSYPQLNGNKDSDKVEEQKPEENEEKSEEEQPSEMVAEKNKNTSNCDESKEDLEEEAEEEKSEEIKEDPEEDEIKDETAGEKETDENKEVETPAGNMALPLEKKRPLPDWMLNVSDTSPPKAKASPKKVKVAAVTKREPGEKLTKDEEKEDEEDDEEEEEKLPSKPSRAKAESDEEEDFDDNVSDDDYVPEASPKPQKSSGRRKRFSDSEEDISDDDDDDDYAPSKKRAKTSKKASKGKGKKVTKGRQTPSRSAKKNTSRKKHYSEDDDDDEVILPRRRGAAHDDDGDSPSRRPQRAARQKRGSYVDDPMIEEALEDFASEGSLENVNEDKDSDFDVNQAVDSGSDWEKKNKKQKVAKPTPKVTKSPRSATKKGKKKAPRRQSKSKSYSDDDDDDELEDDEPYVPRPSKRRGGAASQESGESDDDKKKRRRREPCQYGHKCYRKNPVHFRTYCHPGDSSYDEEDKDTSGAKDGNKKTKDTGKTSPEKPSRPQRSTAGTRLVPQGAVDDDLPDTYDYNDSFVDDGTQATDDSGQDSDYDAGQDTRDNKKTSLLEFGAEKL